MKEYQQYGQDFRTENSVIEMCLDLNKGTLSYIINGTNYGVAHDDIDTNKEYKLFITISGYGTTFEIVSYDQR